MSPASRHRLSRCVRIMKVGIQEISFEMNRGFYKGFCVLQLKFAMPSFPHIDISIHNDMKIALGAISLGHRNVLPLT